MLSLGVGTPLVLVSGGMFLLLWRRRSKQNKPAVQGMFGNTQASPWMDNYEMPTIPNASQYAPDAALAPGMSGAFPMLGNTQAMPFPQPTNIHTQRSAPDDSCIPATNAHGLE